MILGYTSVLSRGFRASCYPRNPQLLFKLPKSSPSTSAYRFNSTVSSRLLTGEQAVSTRLTSAAARVPWLYKAAGVAGVGLGLALYTTSNALFCEPESHPIPDSPPPPHLPPPASSVKYLELSFGTICGICAGVFVKKGAKAVAFILGGAFVFLQYLGSLSLLRVDWRSAAQRFENLLYTKDATGTKRPPKVGSLFRWFIDFLTADFQQRASFIAGFALGLRIG
ncbi:hypothetical protein CERSUDRAFT_48388 [Gelatoporia subvermispora B]|uniref:Uncharacterized protein n=1 Tax=Ceriporiopsis subvermispora (strain B) TaxID=914234 RepID=M2RJ08_CERS8|nr:hypothetical protein CERSUDRAFT_48388 [Gelatoporia subvermispora B]